MSDPRPDSVGASKISMIEAAICVRCGAAKELALARCAECGLVPTDDARAMSVLASTRMLDEAGLREVQRRIRAGEPFRPARHRLELARKVLAGSASIEPFTFTRNQAIALVVANLLLTPALGFAVWLGVRHRPGLGGRQALWLTIPVSVALTIVWGCVFFTFRAH